MEGFTERWVLFWVKHLYELKKKDGAGLRVNPKQILQKQSDLVGMADEDYYTPWNRN